MMEIHKLAAKITLAVHGWFRMSFAEHRAIEDRLIRSLPPLDG